MCNNLVANNDSSGLSIQAYKTILINNTIVNNGRWGIRVSGSNIDILNSISWGNQYLSIYGTPTVVQYSDIQGSQMNRNPLFVAPSNGFGSGYDGYAANWTLNTASPCINTGYPDGAYPAIDLAGNPRVYGDTIDIGAYEFQGVVVSIPYYKNQDQISIYSNPFSHSAILSLKSITVNMELSIVDIYGRIIRTIYPKENKILLKRDNLPNGIYIIQLKHNNEVISSKKIIITD